MKLTVHCQALQAMMRLSKLKKTHHKHDKKAHKMKPSAKDESEKMSVPLDEWKAVMEFVK